MAATPLDIGAKDEIFLQTLATACMFLCYLCSHWITEKLAPTQSSNISILL